MADVGWETSSGEEEDLVSAAHDTCRTPPPPAVPPETSVAVSVAGPHVHGPAALQQAHLGGTTVAVTAPAATLQGPGSVQHAGPPAVPAPGLPATVLAWADSDEELPPAGVQAEVFKAFKVEGGTAGRFVPSLQRGAPPAAEPPVTWIEEEGGDQGDVATPGAGQQHASGPADAAAVAVVGALPPAVYLPPQQHAPGGAVLWADDEDGEPGEVMLPPPPPPPPQVAPVAAEAAPPALALGWADEDEDMAMAGPGAGEPQPPAVGGFIGAAVGWADEEDQGMADAPPPQPLEWEDDDIPAGVAPPATGGAATTTHAGVPAQVEWEELDDDGGSDGPPAGDGHPDDSDSGMDVQTEGATHTNDSQCAVCDDGGDLLLCEGVCRRSFHADPDGDGGSCLGMTADEFAAITASAQLWVCPACQTGRHACARCRRVGPKWSPPTRLDDPEVVFHCSAYGCSRFYHLACSAAAREAVQRQSLGEGVSAAAAVTNSLLFTCEAHLCASGSCPNRLDTASNPVIPCQRCPQGYHIGCLPPSMLGGPVTRIWLNPKHAPLAGWDPKGSQVSCSLLYCERHTIRAGEQAPELLPPVSTAMTDAQRKAGTEPARRVFTEDVLHAAAQLSAAATGEATRCLGCSALVHPPPPSHEELQGAEAAAAQVAYSVLDAARREPRCSFASIRAKLKDHRYSKDQRRGPGAFLSIVPRTVTLDRLGELENYMVLVQRGQVVMPEQVFTDEVKSKFRQLRGSLNPFLLGPRYSSFGRHFTRPRILHSCASYMALFLRHSDCCIDTSCGANDWLPAVQRTCRQHGIQGVQYRAFDLFPAQNRQPGAPTVADWFTVDAEQLRLAPHGHLQPDQLVMGLNPPFGFGNAQAEAFIQHMASFRPRLIVLIVPQKRRCRWTSTPCLCATPARARGTASTCRAATRLAGASATWRIGTS